MLNLIHTAHNKNGVFHSFTNMTEVKIQNGTSGIKNQNEVDYNEDKAKNYNEKKKVETVSTKGKK